MLMKIKRGDILYADLGVQYQGSMQGGMRPVVVVQQQHGKQAQHCHYSGSAVH